MRIASHRVEVTDKLSNTGQEDVGILYRNELTTDRPFEIRLLAGANQARASMTAENPSVFVGQKTSRLGWLAEDTVHRLQLDLAASTNQVKMSVNRFAIAPGKSYTFRWAIYPMHAEADYWAFINQVRRDWDVNFTLQGPFDYFSVTEQLDLIRNHKRLKSYLTRKKLKVIAFQPWVDYDNYSFITGRPISRAEMKPLLLEAMAAIKRVDAEILCIGCIEGNLVSLPPNAQKALWDSAPNRPQGQYPLTDEQMTILRKYDIQWKDCLLQNKAGQYRYELYYRGPKDGEKIPMIAIGLCCAR